MTCRIAAVSLLFVLLTGCASAGPQNEGDDTTETSSSPSPAPDISDARRAELEEAFCAETLAYLAESGKKEVPEDCERVVMRRSERLDRGGDKGFLVTVVLGVEREKIELGARVDADDVVELRSLESSLDRAAIEQAELDLQNLHNLIETFYLQSDPNRLPESLRELTAKPHQFIDEVPTDPWGQRYVYRPEERGEDFELFSAGPDGEPDTADDVRLER